MLTLDKDEKIVTQIRKHPFVLIIESAFLGVFVTLPPILYAIYSKATQDMSMASGAGFYFFTFLYSIILLGAFITFFSIFTNYYLDILIVTNDKLIDIDQIRFFNREVAIVKLENVQDITTRVSGFIPSILDFGELHIQTAGESREFIIRDIPNPDEVRKLIFKLHSLELEEPKSVKIVQ